MPSRDVKRANTKNNTENIHRKSQGASCFSRRPPHKPPKNNSIRNGNNHNNSNDN